MSGEEYFPRLWRSYYYYPTIYRVKVRDWAKGERIIPLQWDSYDKSSPYSRSGTLLKS